MPVRLLHEAVLEEVQSAPGMSLRLSEAIEHNTLPPAYLNHPLVVGAAEPQLPLALFLDGVACSLRDSVVGMWGINLLADQRYILALVRKGVACCCGCHGWDTWFPIMQCLHWQLSALANGSFPDRQHDDTPWPAGSPRAAVAGSPLGFKCVFAFVKQKRLSGLKCVRDSAYRALVRIRGRVFCVRQARSSSIGLWVFLWSLRLGTLMMMQTMKNACVRCENWIDLDADLHGRMRTCFNYEKDDW